MPCLPPPPQCFWQALEGACLSYLTLAADEAPKMYRFLNATPGQGSTASACAWNGSARTCCLISGSSCFTRDS